MNAVDSPSLSPSDRWWRFLPRLCDLVMAPRSTVMAIARAERNVFWDAFYFLVLQTLALRLPDLVRATWLGLRVSPSGGVSQILSVFVDELRTAAWVVLPVAVVVFLVAGRERRSPAVALDLGAAGSSRATSAR